MGHKGLRKMLLSGNSVSVARDAALGEILDSKEVG